MKTILALAILCAAGIAAAGDFRPNGGLAWWYDQNVAPVTEEITQTRWQLETVPGTPSNLVTRIKAGTWNVPGHTAPEWSTLTALWASTIEPWWTAKQAEWSVDPLKRVERLVRAALLVNLDGHNAHVTATGHTGLTRTPAQFYAAVTNKLATMGPGE